MEDVENLDALPATLNDATEIMAAFIGAAKDGNQSMKLLIVAAEGSLADRIIWRNTIAGVIDIAERVDVH